MSVTYLDTVHAIAEAEGLAYGQITKAMKVHVRSLVSDGYVRNFTEAGEVTSLDDPEGVVWFTAEGAGYLECLREAGLVALPVETPTESEAPKPTTRRKRSRKASKVSRSQGSPKPREQVTSPVLPEGMTATRVPGNHLGDQLVPDAVMPSPEEMFKQMQEMARSLSALKAVVLA